MPAFSQSRDRGRLLTPEALARLEQAIQQWQQQNDKRLTYERWRELTSVITPGGFDPTTLSKIRKGKVKVDRDSIRIALESLGLILRESDLISLPSVTGSSAPDPNFVGREEAIEDLDKIVNQGAKVIVIKAKGGVGKTTLAKRYLKQRYEKVIEFNIAKEVADIAPIENLLSDKLLRFLNEEPGQDFFVDLDRFKDKLKKEKIAIYIDNFETLLDSNGRVIQPHRRYVEFLRVLTDPEVQSLTIITSRERLRESSLTVEPYLLSGLTLESWETYFQNKGLSTQTEALQELHKAHGGNAKAMEILCSAIREDYQGNIFEYWESNQENFLTERDLEDLVQEQFKRLQELDQDAYKLLCRMGCYRFQDVPTIPIEGLYCLLWDVPQNLHRRAIDSLRDRSLIEFETKAYWLHPVIRYQCLQDLHAKKLENFDYRLTNEKIAEFWNSFHLNVQDLNIALKAFEAFYHFCEAEAWSRASHVLNKRDQGVQLREYLRYQGYADRLILALNQLEGKLTNSFYEAERLGTLGVCYYYRCDYQAALIYLEKAVELLSQTNDFDWVAVAMRWIAKIYWLSGRLQEGINVCKRGLDLISGRENEIIHDSIHSNLFTKIVLSSVEGFIYLDLYEIDQALEKFQLVLSYIDSLEEGIDTEILDAYAGSALAYFQKNQVSTSIDLMETAIRKFSHIGNLLSTIFSKIYLGRFYLHQKNYLLVEQIIVDIEFCSIEMNKNSYIGLEFLILLGCYNRAKGEFKLALDYHHQSIQGFSNIGMKLSVAEAYYELAITHQQMGSSEEAKEAFEEAIKIYQEMEAPKQIDRINQILKSV